MTTMNNEENMTIINEECKIEEDEHDAPVVLHPAEEAEEEAEEDPSPKESSTGSNGFMKTAQSKALRPFVIISSSYLLFTITDGAIRMIVLLHAYNKQFSALDVSIMFTLYELAGVVTNLAAGFMGAKWGIKVTLLTGLSFQLLSYGLLFGWNDSWTKQQAIVYVTIAQMFAGIAKDLTKLGGKTITKLVTPEERETQLFQLVSFITGWKNSLKGVGYFLGSALLQVNYQIALGSMIFLILLAMPWAILGLSNDLGTAKTNNAKWTDVFTLDNPNLNILSLARLFLFASRDFWFEVPLPFYLRSPQCQGLGQTPCYHDPYNNTTMPFPNDYNNTTLTDDDDDVCTAGSYCNVDAGVCENNNIGGGCGGMGLDRVLVGALLGGYIILYGQIQSYTPQLVTGPLQQTPPNKYTEILWGFINCIPTFVMGIVLTTLDAFRTMETDPTNNKSTVVRMVWMLVTIVTFAAIFAVNSSIHSYLVVSYAKKDKVAVSVGFYYMSNALGRLLGTIGSGLLYTHVGDSMGPHAGNYATSGFAACFFAGTLSSLLAAMITMKLKDDPSHPTGLKCGSCWTLLPAHPTTTNATTEQEQEQEQPLPMVAEEQEQEQEQEKKKTNNDHYAPNTGIEQENITTLPQKEGEEEQQQSV